MYGKLPKNLGAMRVETNEMFWYQYLPIKFPGSEIKIEDRLKCFTAMIGKAACDFVAEDGLERYNDSYIYLTAKRLFQKDVPFNRPGFHSDGFLTNDVSYIWSDKQPTVFNCSNFSLSLDECESLQEMERQALSENNFIYPNSVLLKLDQYVIHKVGGLVPGVRTFVKICFSKDKYDLEGNSHNYMFDYDWKLRKRGEIRNVPQKLEPELCAD